MEEYYNQWLCSLRGMTNQALLRGLAYFETPGAIYEAGRAELLKVFTEYQTGVIEASRKRLDSLEKLQMEYDRLEERHIHFVSQGHPFYPGRLLDIPDAPLGLSQQISRKHALDILRPASRLFQSQMDRTFLQCTFRFLPVICLK